MHELLPARLRGSSLWLGAVLALLLGACTEGAPAAPNIEDLCFDADGDGYGEGCAAGDDCNDHDPTLHDDCPACSRIETGCECEAGSAPVDCVAGADKISESSLLCTTGKRYCRDGSWTECSALTTFELTAQDALSRSKSVYPNRGVRKQGMDAGTTCVEGQGCCSVCEPSCFLVDDDLTNAANEDAGLVFVDGGLSVDLNPVDAARPPPPDGCPYYDDVDCDGVPDSFDEYPDGAPFDTDYDTIFMQLGPGSSASSSFDVNFFLNEADIYFLVDMTGSMGDERTKLIADLTSGNFLTGDAATEDCVDNDLIDPANVNDRKNQGIAGNIACLVRDAYLGAGWFRDVPFAGDNRRGGNDPFYMFGNEQDLTPNVADVLLGINRFQTVGNSDWPEGHMYALHALVTGEQVYTGWDHPGIPPRRGCPDGTWGWPCFREGAVPVVILISDAAMTNGPELTTGYYGTETDYLRFSGTWRLNLQSSDWDQAQQGTGAQYVPIYPFDNEALESAVDLGALEDSSNTAFGSFADKLVTFTGDTSGMSTDIDAEALGCGSSFASGADAVFKFSLDSQKEITVSAQGTRFSSRLILLSDINVVQGSETASGNDLVSAPWTLNGGSGLDNYFNIQVTGSTAGFGGEFPWSSFGGCETGSSDTAADAVFRFTPSASGTVNFKAGGSSAPMALALFPEEPQVPTTQDLPNDTSMDQVGGFSLTLTADGTYHRLTNGTTDDPDLNADYPAELFNAAGCAVSGDPADAVIDFTVLSDGTTVEISSGAAGLNGAAGFDHAIALIDRTGVVSSPSPTASSIKGAVDSASVTTPIDEADFVDGWLQFTDTLDASKEDSYDQDDLGGSDSNACGSTPGADDDAWDSVYEFTLTDTRLVEINTDGSSFDTYLSLHKDDVSCSSSGGGGGGVSVGPQDITLSGRDNDPYDTSASAYDLGSLESVTVTTVDGSTDSRNLAADYTGANNRAMGEVGGNSCGYNDDGFNLVKDMVFKFTLTSTRNLSIALSADNDSAALGVFSSLSSDSSFTRIECGVSSSGTTSISTQDFGPGTYYIIVKTGDFGRSRPSRDDGDDYILTVTNNDASGGGGGGGSSSTCGNSLSGTTVSATPGSSYDTYGEAYDLGDLFGVASLQVDGNNSTAGSGRGGTAPASCGDAGNEQWFTFTVSSATTLNFSSTGHSNSNMDVTLSVFEDGAGDADEIGCDADSGSSPSNAADLTVDVSPGHTYYLLFQGRWNDGAWTIDVNDTVNAGAGGFVACSGAPPTSRIVEYLQAGTYYVVVSAGAASTGGDYTLNLREGRAVGALGGELLACDQDGAGTREGRITQTLDAGDYSVIIRGAQDGAQGDYGVTIRDTTTSGSATAVACHAAQTGSGSNSFSYDVNAGQTYYLVLRGEETGDSGAYSLNVWNASVGNFQTTQACVSGTVDGQPETRTTLDAGDYYAILKGRSAGNEGIYQLTIGDRNQQSTLNMDAPTYLGSDGTGTTDGVLKELNARSVRVLSVLSGYDSSSYDKEGLDQMQTLSKATGAVDSDDQPLTYRIGHDGSGMGEEIIRAVQELVGSLEMDVTVVLNQGTDPPPAPGFTFSVLAIDPGTNYGCSGVIDSPVLNDADSLPDTHTDCVPGAQPSFTVTFENPVGAPVPKNPNDPNGGYHMQLDLIGDGTYFIASIPVYIIPEDPVEDEVDEPAVASFTEDAFAAGCVATEGPDWSGLTWTASLPVDTQISWKMCTGATAADLEGCDMRTIATVTSDGSACTSSDDCLNGFCQAGTCQYPVSGDNECNRDSDCGTNGICLTASGRCVWTALPIDPHPALTPGMQGLPYARLSVSLQSTPSQESAPVLYDYQLRYECTPFE